MKTIESVALTTNGKENIKEELIEVRMDIPSPESPPKMVRKSFRTKKAPIHLIASALEENQKLKAKAAKAKTIRMKTQYSSNLYNDFKCDHCGSRYVVNPMRRGNKISTSKYKAAPRHKVDPETQNLLTLCNACGLKFGRTKKNRFLKAQMSGEDQEQFLRESEQFGKDLALKLENESASQLFCAHTKKIGCGCIQKYIIGNSEDSEWFTESITERAKELLEVLEKANELKKMKCYDPAQLEKKPGKTNSLKIGLGNGHRKSKEFEDYVLNKRVMLRNDMKLCEKAAQRILSYSNNFLHKRMKTDPNKGIRVERQKGKAALGKLKDIEDLPLEPCCADNCVRMALTHFRLLRCWRERATSGQVEARRVLAEMLTPSGGNRANCYKFISWVTGCSNSTIGKVNEQMKSTGGDREPPEHGLKKYWRVNPKSVGLNGEETEETAFVPSYQILQTAASSAGLAPMMQQSAETEKPLAEPQKKRTRKKAKNNTDISKNDVGVVLMGEKIDFNSARTGGRIPANIKIVENTDSLVSMSAQNTNLSTYPSAVIAVNGQFSNNGFISIPAGLTNESTVTVPNTMTLQALQLQQQQQLQLQIQLLQQQLQNSQATLAAQAQAAAQQAIRQPMENAATEYIVTPSAIEQSVGNPVVVQAVTTPIQASVIQQNVVPQNLVPNVVNTETVMPTIVASANNNPGLAEFLTPTANMNNILQAIGNNQTKVTPNISLMTSPLRNTNNEINILTTLANPVSLNMLNTASISNLTDSSPLTDLRAAAQQVHLIAATQAPPTVAAVSQPMTISLQQPSISLATLPTMLFSSTTHDPLVQPTVQSHTQQQQLIIQQTAATTPQIQRVTEPQHMVLQRAITSYSNPVAATNQLIVYTTPQTPDTNNTLNTMLPPITSFNADAFLTSVSSGVGTAYTVVHNTSMADL